MQLNLLTRLEKCLEIMQFTLVIGWLALISSYIKNRTEPSCIHYSVPFRDAAKHSFQVVYRHFFISTMVRTYISSEPLPAIISTTRRSFVFLSQLTVLTFFFCANFSCLQRPPVINGAMATLSAFHNQENRLFTTANRKKKKHVRADILCLNCFVNIFVLIIWFLVDFDSVT